MILPALAFAACVLAALALTLPAFLRRPPASDNAEDGRRRANIAAARERLRALAVAAANGEISQAEADEYAMEIENALLQDVDDEASAAAAPPPPAGKQDKMGAVVCAVVLAAGAPALYALVGAPQTLRPPPGMDEIIVRLQQAAEEKPNDHMAHYWLAYTYAKMQENKKAARHYARALKLAPDNAQTIASYVELLLADAAAADRDLINRLLADGLRVAPQDSVLLWLAGENARQQDKTAAALAFWRRARANAKDAQFKEGVSRVIADAEANAPAAAASQAQVTVVAQLAAGMSAPTSANAALFVFARAAAADAPPLPLAVWKKQGNLQFPVTVVLGDNLAMTPQHKMSAHKNYKIAARISPAASATPQSGDLTAAAVTTAAPAAITLTINARLP